MEATPASLSHHPSIVDTNKASTFLSSSQLKVAGIALGVIAIVAALVVAEVKYKALTAVLALALAHPIASLVIAFVAIGVIIYLTVRICRKPQERQSEKPKEGSLTSSVTTQAAIQHQDAYRSVPSSSNASVASSNATTSQTQNSGHAAPVSNATNDSCVAEVDGIGVVQTQNNRTSTTSAQNRGASSANHSTSSQASGTNTTAAKQTASTTASKPKPKPFDDLVYDFYFCIYETKKTEGTEKPKDEIHVLSAFEVIDGNMAKIRKSAEGFIKKYAGLTPEARNQIEVYTPSIEIFVRGLGAIAPTSYSSDLKERFAALANKDDYIAVYNTYLELLSLKVADLDWHIQNDIDLSEDQEDTQSSLGYIELYELKKIDAKGCIYLVFNPWLIQTRKLFGDNSIIDNSI